MQTICNTPLPIALRLGDDGWEILTPPGAFAQLLHQLSGAPLGIPVETIRGQAMAVIPYTDALDTALQELVDTFISLRYATGQVQLALFAVEDV